MKLIKKNLLIISLLSLFLLLSSATVKAENLTSRVSLNVIHPENQIDKSVQYFDLRMKVGEKQRVLVKLTNHTNEEINMQLSYNSAKTTSIGEIEYSENQLIEVDRSLKYDFTELVTGPNKVRLKPKETTDVEINIAMPDVVYDGWIAGGIEFTEEPVEKSTKAGAVVTESSYLVGMRLSETDKKLPIDIQLNSVRLAQKNYQNAVVVSLSNINSNYVEELTTEVKVRAAGTSEIILQESRKNMRMAPNSQMEYPLYLEDKLLDEGMYVAEVSLKSPEKYAVTWEEEFKVSVKERKLLSETREEWQEEEAPFKKTKISLIIVIGILVIVNLAVLYLNSKSRRKNKK